jgi:branched-chain amino acid transport system permease protein
MMWNLLAGYAGLVSLGQQVFIGLGGYCLAVFTENFGLPLPVAIFIGGVAAVLFALVSTIVLFRMRSVYFTIATWILAECLVVIFGNWDYVRMGMGFFIRAGYDVGTKMMYYPAMVIGFAAVLLVYFLLRSKLGLGLMAMRDEEDAAETAGVEIFRSKLYCFLIGAFVTGIAGGVIYLSQGFIKPEAAFSINWTVAVVFIVVIGGIGTVEGPVIGAFVYVALTQILASYPGYSLLVLGVIAILVILFAPEGVMGLLRRRWPSVVILSPRRE